MTFFSKVFKSKDASRANTKNKTQHVDTSNGQVMPQAKPKYVATWASKEIDPDEVEELIHVCTLIMKSRAEALDAPFLLLPFRPETDTAPARNFVTNFYKANHQGSRDYTGSSLRREIVLTDPAVLCSILKWCWSRMPGGVVTWPVYEGFCLGEQDSNMARHAFDTFVPLSVDSPARKNIIVDFFDLLMAIAAHGKTNGLGGRKLSRMAGWWAFEHIDDGKGFESGYKSWLRAADASSHLFFAYLRSLEPEALDGFTGINGLPRSLQALMAQTEYPPETPALMQKTTPKVVMLVDIVSPGPFTLLRRAKNFEYRDEELQMFSEYADPVQALTEECKRVLNCIASANHSAAARSESGMSLALDGFSNKPDESWSRFQDFGFSSISDNANKNAYAKGASSMDQRRTSNLRSKPRSRAANSGRPTTPSWADFLNSGFADEPEVIVSPTALLPPDKMLPPIGGSLPSSPAGFSDDDLNHGELASITRFDLDDSFWWVWIASLASEEPAGRKAVFGRCALVETGIITGRWILLEEQVKGAASVPEEGAYIAEKKPRFGFSLKNKTGRRRSAVLPQKSINIPALDPRAASTTPNKASMSPGQQARIRAAAATLSKQPKKGDDSLAGQRRGRNDDSESTKTNSVLTLGLTSEAAPAMKWAHAFDKEEIRKQYLGDNFAGKGIGRDVYVPDSAVASPENSHQNKGSARPSAPTQVDTSREPPTPPAKEAAFKELPPMPQPSAPAIYVDAATDEDTKSAERPVQNSSPTSGHPEGQDATAVPLITSAAPKVTHVERKPVPSRANNIKDHPAFRPQKSNRKKSSEETPSERAARQAWEYHAATFSPDALPDSSKKSGKGGFRNMFSRKKDDGKRKSIDQPVSMASLAPPSESSIGRKLSLLRKKPPTPNPQTMPAAPVPAPVPAAEKHSPEVSPSKPNALEQPLAQSQAFGGDDHAISPVPTPVNHEEEFARFDHGPLSDAPAWTPRESIDSHLQAEEEHKADLEAGHLDAPGGFPETPLEYGTPAEGDSADYMGAKPTSKSPQQDKSQFAAQGQNEAYDRWAQIRRNAAERAARPSDDLPRRPSHTTERTEDDGETSGEETIEERVARIKSRVAHLTGNFEPRPVQH